MWLYLKGLVADSKHSQGAIIGNCEQPLKIRLNPTYVYSVFMMGAFLYFH